MKLEFVNNYGVLDRIYMHVIDSAMFHFLFGVFLGIFSIQDRWFNFKLLNFWTSKYFRRGNNFVLPFLPREEKIAWLNTQLKTWRIQPLLPFVLGSSEVLSNKFYITQWEKDFTRLGLQEIFEVRSSFVFNSKKVWKKFVRF
jgi:hypothetical protein